MRSLFVWIRFSALAFIFVGSSTLEADPVSVNPRPRQRMMGGAGLADFGSKDSASINPSGLVDIKEWSWDILPLVIEAPFEMDTISDYQDFADARDAADAARTAGTMTQTQANNAKAAALETFMGKISTSAATTRFNFYPSWTARYMHIGVLADFLVDAKLRAGAALGNEVSHLGGSAGTMGLIMAGAYSFLDESLHVGLTVKPLYRFSVTNKEEQTLYDFVLADNKVGSTTSDVGIKKMIVGDEYTDNKAFGVGVDLGLRYDLPFFTFLKPAVGLTYQDIGNTRFMTSTAQPANIEQSISVGVAAHPDFWILRNTVAVDMRNINEEQDFLNKVHVGAESLVWNFLAFRVGLSQGYFSGGMGLDLRFLQLDAYVAAWEAGTRAHLQDMRVVGLKLAFAI